MALYRMVFVGLSPLLTHNPASMQKTRASAKGSNIPEPEVEAEAGTYRLEDGTCAIMGIGFRNGLIAAAGAWKKPRGRGSMASDLAHVVVREELIPLYRADGSIITDYEIDRRRAVVQKNGIVRARPKYKDWGGFFTVEYDEALVANPQILVDICNDSGNRMGIGDYRPAKKGWFGRYAIIEAFGIASEARKIPEAKDLVKIARKAA